MNKDNSSITSQPKSKKAILLGVLILALQIGILFAYGFAGQFKLLTSNNISTTYEPLWLVQYFYLTLFVVGMGLMLSYYGKGTALGLGTAIFALAVNILLGPLLQKFWFNVFLGGFDNTALITASNLLTIFKTGNTVNLSTIAIYISTTMTISYLISALAFVGRAGLFQIFTSLLVFNIMWPISFFVNLRIYLNNMPNKISFDDFGLTYVYTFAAVFGIVYSIFLNFKKQKTVDNSHISKTSIILAIFGATLVFCAHPTTGFLYQIQSNAKRANIGTLNMYFSAISSIIFCTIFTLLFGKGRFRIEQIIVSVLSGPAISAQIAGAEGNIVGFLTIGAIGGVLTAIWIQIIHPKINKNSIEDSIGLIGGVLVPSFFGGVIVAPVMFRIYIDNKWKFNTGLVNDEELIRHNYYYYFITVGTAMVAGIIAGALSCCTAQSQNSNTHYKMFSADFGLCNNPSEEAYKREKRQEEKQSSAINLRNN